MILTQVFDAVNKPQEAEKSAIIDFLFTNLDEYGDPKADIEKAIDYALQNFDADGGFVGTLNENGKIKGAVVVNKTGMAGYIPENILVYIAIHRDHRGEGLGKKLMQLAIDNAEGDIALHVEHNNPAKFLYEKMGFTNPYLEMRLKR